MMWFNKLLLARMTVFGYRVEYAYIRLHMFLARVAFALYLVWDNRRIARLSVCIEERCARRMNMLSGRIIRSNSSDWEVIRAIKYKTKKADDTIEMRKKVFTYIEHVESEKSFFKEAIHAASIGTNVLKRELLVEKMRLYVECDEEAVELPEEDYIYLEEGR